MVTHVHDMAGSKNKQLFFLQEVLDFEQVNEKQTVALVQESNRMKSDSVGLTSIVACSRTLLRERHIRMPNYYSDVCIMKSDFVDDYRVSRRTFTKLRDVLSTQLPTNMSHGGSPPMGSA